MFFKVTVIWRYTRLEIKLFKAKICKKGRYVGIDK